MGLIGFLALAANVASVLLLMSYKDGDANVRSVWLCSRNDAIGNVIVMIAALGVWGTATAWPDLIVAGIMAGLFLNSSAQILTQSFANGRRARRSRCHPLAAGRRRHPVAQGMTTRGMITLSMRMAQITRITITDVRRNASRPARHHAGRPA